MATLLSIPTTVTVLAPGSSVLSTMAAAMAPGTWAQLSPQKPVGCSRCRLHHRQHDSLLQRDAVESRQHGASKSLRAIIRRSPTGLRHAAIRGGNKFL